MHSMSPTRTRESSLGPQLKHRRGWPWFLTHPDTPPNCLKAVRAQRMPAAQIHPHPAPEEHTRGQASPLRPSRSSSKTTKISSITLTNPKSPSPKGNHSKQQKRNFEEILACTWASDCFLSRPPQLPHPQEEWGAGLKASLVRNKSATGVCGSEEGAGSQHGGTEWL